MSHQRKNVGCGVSIRGAGEDYGACVGGTESKLRPLCDEQLYSLYIYIGVNKSRRMRWEEYVARTKGREVHMEILIDIFINCSWVVTRWQYTFTHKQYIEQHK